MGVNIIGTPLYEERKSYIKYIINALTVFICAFGSVTYFLSALSIEYYPIIVFMFVAVESICCAFVYIGKVKRIFGYLALVAVFGLFVYAFQGYINSGFSHILNELYNTVDLRYNLGITKEYYEIYEDSVQTVTIFAITIGFVLCVTINALISETMNGVFIILVEFLFMAIPLYFGMEPSVIAQIMVVVGPFMAVIAKNTRKYDTFESKTSYVDEKDHLINRLLKRTNEKKKIYKNKYNAQGYYKCRIMPGILAKQMLVCGIAFTAVVIIINMAVPKKMTSGTNNRIETATKEWVKQFAMYGLDSVFSYGKSNNGIMDGTFSDDDMLRFNYQTLLQVEYVDTNHGRSYLRSYIGDEYTSDGWVQSDSYQLENYIGTYKGNLMEKIYDMTANQLDLRYRMYQDNFLKDGVIRQKMKIRNVGINGRNQRPSTYYSLEGDDVSYLSDKQMRADFLRNEEYELTFYPGLTDYLAFNGNILPGEKSVIIDKNNNVQKQKDYLQEINDQKMIVSGYDDYVKDTYLTQPASVARSVKDFMNRYGLSTVYGEDNPDEYYSKNGFDLQKEMEAVQSIGEIFENDYEYTLAPGKTPEDEDYVDYFLNQRKNGYCVHFASSAVLILRQMGIPARYVEGYVVDPENAINVEYLHDEDRIKEEYIQGDNEEKYNTLLTVGVTDASGHAWAEIYVSGFGWVPVDITPSSDEEDDETQSGFSQFVSNFTQTMTGAGQNISEGLKVLGENTRLIIGCTAGSMAMLLIIWSIFIVAGDWKRKIIFNGNDYDKAVLAMATYALRIFKFAGVCDNKGMTFKEYASVARDKGMVELSDAIRIIEPTQRKVYGGYPLTNQEKEQAKIGIARISNSVYKNLKWYKKIQFVLIKRMTVYNAN